MNLLKNNHEIDRWLKQHPIQIFKTEDFGVYFVYPYNGHKIDRSHVIYYLDAVPYVIEYFLDNKGRFPAKYLFIAK